MEKPITPTTYLLHGNRVEIMPYFLYEVNLYRITKDMVYLIDSRYYKSDKPLSIKKHTIKKDKGIVQYIDILGVTKEFVKENRLPIFQLNKKSIKKKKK